ILFVKQWYSLEITREPNTRKKPYLFESRTKISQFSVLVTRPKIDNPVTSVYKKIALAPDLTVINNIIIVSESFVKFSSKIFLIEMNPQ
ncbi:hypothetical protein L9F63_004553, partial [Diploptera punctata]